MGGCCLLRWSEIAMGMGGMRRGGGGMVCSLRNKGEAWCRCLGGDHYTRRTLVVTQVSRPWWAWRGNGWLEGSQ